MTILSPPAGAALVAPRPLVRRLGNVIRLHLANPSTIFGMPLMILGVIFAANLMIWWIVATATTSGQAVENLSEGFQFSGASLWIFFYMMVVAVQAMNLSFPFALGFGSTRRDFYLGTALAFVGLSAFYSLIYTAMSILESVTNGWGVGGVMFRSLYFGSDDNWVTRMYFVFVTFLFFFFVGAAVASTYVRWRQRGLIGFFAVFALALIGGLALITWTQSWPAVGEFFVAVGYLGGFTLGIIPTAVAAIGGYLLMRRATPRS
jgi:hypothetical protein